MATFKPSISYWYARGNDVRPAGEQKPSFALNHTSLLLLIHGYNNNIDAASMSYDLFLKLQNALSGKIEKNIVGVYWPGANWEGVLYYMQAVGKAKSVGPKLAEDLYRQAQLRGYLEVEIIAHSLGCRLTLEMVKHLLSKKANDPSLGGLVLKSVVLMAGAVATKYLDDINRLGDALVSFGGALSIFSEKDYVLKYAFPLGQSLVGERFLPIALGRQEWAGGYQIPLLKQRRNTGAGHSDYWGGENKNLDKKTQAAKIISEFLNLDKKRSLLNRTSAPRETISRDSGKARKVSERTV